MNAICHGIDLDRDHAVLAIRAFGGDKRAKSIWGKLSGYSQRALVEITFSPQEDLQRPIFSRARERQERGEQTEVSAPEHL